MKRLLALLLAVILCFSLLACQKEEKKDAPKEEIGQSQETDKEQTTEENDRQTEEDDPENKEDPQKEEDSQRESLVSPLLYKVTDEEGNVVWLFGSIHVGQENFYPLPDYVEDAFAGADALAVEADIIAFEKDLKAQMKAMKLLVYPDLSTIDEHIPAELYDRAKGILEEIGLYNSAFDLYVPYLWGNLIANYIYQENGLNAELGVDRHLLNWAKEDDMPIYEIESAEIQYGILAGFSEELQIFLLEDAIAEYEDQAVMVESTQKMLDMWAAGDEEGLLEMLNEEVEVTEDQKTLWEEYQEVLITNRNITMTDYAEDALASGEEVFICVGAAHVVGEGAMADLLAQRGYTVELVR